MRRRLLLVLFVLAALAFASVAVGGGGAKYKLTLNSLFASCNKSCGDLGAIVIKRLGDNRTSCRPFFDDSGCKWTAPAGTEVVLEVGADPRLIDLINHTWNGACSGTRNCTVVMDANKQFGLALTVP